MKVILSGATVKDMNGATHVLTAEVRRLTVPWFCRHGFANAEFVPTGEQVGDTEVWRQETSGCEAEESTT